MASEIPEVDLEQLKREHKVSKPQEDVKVEASPTKKSKTSEDNKSNPTKKQIDMIMGRLKLFHDSINLIKIHQPKKYSRVTEQHLPQLKSIARLPLRKRKLSSWINLAMMP